MNRVRLWVVLIPLIFLPFCSASGEAFLHIGGEESRIVLFRNVGGPPIDPGGDAIYTKETTFYPDGRVEHIERSYDGAIRNAETWQVDARNYGALMYMVRSEGFFTLPERFSYGAYDAPVESLSVYTAGNCYSSGYAPAQEPEDKASFTILTTCCEAFKEQTVKP